MLNLAVEGLEILRDEIPSLLGENSNHTAAEIILAKYYEYSQRFCISQDDEANLKQKFNQIVLADYRGTEYDIDALIHKMYPLGIPVYVRKPAKKAEKSKN